MLLLSLDTSTSSGSIALLRDFDLLGAISAATGDQYSSRLFRHLDFLLAEHSASQKDIELYAIISGPGSFSGLRVGLTAVKAWAEVFGKPIVPLSGLEVIAACARTSAPLIAPCFDARRGQLYAALFEHTPRGLHRLFDDTVLTPAEYFAAVNSAAASRPVLFATTTPAALEPALAASPLTGSAVERILPILAPRAGWLALECFRRGEFTDALHLDAHYVRRTDAELHCEPR